MKRLLLFLACLMPAFGQNATTPDCGSNTFTFTAIGSSNNIATQGNTRCTFWTVTYYAEGFSALSLQFESAPDVNGSPGSFSAVSTGIQIGVNPMTSTTQTFLVVQVYAPWFKIHVTSVTGSGKIVAK